jgi:hypothetical protein
VDQETDAAPENTMSARTAAWPIPATAFVSILQVLQLRYQGRVWWCSCGHWWPWAGDVWTLHNSQHIADPYSFTHVLHGVVLCGVLAWVGARLPWVWRLVIAVAIEAAWEVFENTEFVIQRYREATLALGYTGDSIANSIGDVAFCIIGFIIAQYLGFRRSVLLFLLIDCALLLWIHDSLVLNIIMLIYPIDAIKTWQMGH